MLISSFLLSKPTLRTSPSEISAEIITSCFPSQVGIASAIRISGAGLLSHKGVLRAKGGGETCPISYKGVVIAGGVGVARLESHKSVVEARVVGVACL